MEKKNLLFVAAAMVMAGCASDDMIGDNAATQSENQVIGFNMSTPAMTRADGTADDAKKLNNEFIVWGEKAEVDKEVTDDENLVFKNYRVQYKASSANTTVSNTNNWEYVGIMPYSGSGTGSTSNDGDESTAYVYPSIYNTTQTIKYWDFGKAYTFTAVSALKKDITTGKVKITKIEGAKNLESKKKGYTIELGEDASVGDIYVADRYVVTQSKPTAGESVKAVQLSFRNFQSKIRFGIYENVPGYKVVITGIKYNDGTTDQKHETAGGTFGVEGNFVLAGKSASNNANTSYGVTYDADNHAQVEVTAGNGKSYYDTGGTNWLNTSWTSTTQNSCIGETAAAATYDKTDPNNTSDKKAYTAILPNPSNKKNLKLQIKYDLYSEDSGEKISVDYKAVEVPAEYCTWKSNYAYTYLFKITDKSAELYPITFDAVVVESTTGNQETITTVDAPSIITYVNGQTANDEYTSGNIIYAFAQDGDVTAMTKDNMKLYKVTTTDGFEITEASVKHALEHTGGKITAKEILSTGDDADKPSYEVIPREDTGNREITGMKWTAAASTTYAVEYSKTVSGATTKYYKIVKVQ